MRWRSPLAIVGVFLTTWGLLQFVWAAHQVALGGANVADGAANEWNGLRTGGSGLVLLAVVVLLSSGPFRHLGRAIWERTAWLW